MCAVRETSGFAKLSSRKKEVGRCPIIGAFFRPAVMCPVAIAESVEAMRLPPSVHRGGSSATKNLTFPPPCDSRQKKWRRRKSLPMAQRVFVFDARFGSVKRV